MKSPGCCQGGTHEISGLGWSKQKAFNRKEREDRKDRKENPQEQLLTPEQFEVGSSSSLRTVHAKRS
jgi:hypothetical protein